MKKPCSNCGTVLIRPKSHFKGVRVYCSRKCQTEWERANLAGVSHGNWKGVSVTCSYCGTVSQRSPSLVADKADVFCDMDCRASWLCSRLTEEYRKDNNHDEIVLALRESGASVAETHEMSRGFPDLVVGYNGENYFIEIKNPRSGHGITDAQVKWHSNWRGQVAVANSAEEALEIIGAI